MHACSISPLHWQLITDVEFIPMIIDGPPAFVVQFMASLKDLLASGDQYTFTTEEGANGTNGRISVNYDGFVDDVSAGDTLLIDGGINSLKILSVDGRDVLTEVVDGGMMKSRCAAWLC